ncbi:MAG: PLDc_N domain-containing protein [Actinobacteria bacterium]|nr:PLDc_N domain-containing protein [Actinomycetota bacterium]
METWKLVILLLPLLILQFTLLIVAIVDLVKRDRVRFDNKALWAVVIVIFNIIGPVVYLTWGREEEGNGNGGY